MCNMSRFHRTMTGEGNVDPAALTRQHHVHAALQASLTLVPSGRSKLFAVLKHNYPHRRLRPEVLSDYALHALRVVQYAPLIEVRVYIREQALVSTITVAGPHDRYHQGLQHIQRKKCLVSAHVVYYFVQSTSCILAFFQWRGFFSGVGQDYCGGG